MRQQLVRVALVSVILAGFVGCTATTATAQDAAPTAAKHFDAANALFAQGDMDGAIAELTAAIELDPNFTDAYVTRGNVFVAKGLPEKALPDFDRVASLAGDQEKYKRVFARRGITYFSIGKLDEALADMQKARQLLPDDDSVANWMALIRFVRGEFPEAGKLWRDLSVRLPYAKMLAYVALASEGKKDEANAFLADAANTPAAEGHWPVIWKFCAGKASEEEARSSLMTVAWDERCETYVVIGQHYMLTGRPDAARRFLESVKGSRAEWATRWCEKELKKIPIPEKTEKDKQAENHFNEAHKLSREDKALEAAAEYTKAIELKPDFSAAYGKRAWMYLNADKPDECMDDCGKVLELSLDFDEIWYAFFDMALAYEKKDDPRNAAQWLIKMTQLAPWAAKPCINTASAYLEMPDYDEALKWLDRAFALGPDYDLGGAYTTRGSIHFSKGDLDKALADYDKSVEILSPLPGKLVHDTEGRHLVYYAYLHRGILYFVRDDLEKSIADLNAALKTDPASGDAMFWLGKCLFDKGDFALAAEMWRKCVEKEPLSALFAAIALERQGKPEEARKFAAEIEGTLKEDWPRALLAAYRGNAVEQECLKDIEKVEVNEQGIRYCVLGNFHLLRGNKDKAKEFLRKCFHDEKTPTLWAYLWAVKDLKKLP